MMLDFLDQTLEVLLPRPFPQRLAVGVSGGGDSICLAFLLSLWGRKNSVTVFALIVDHRLREESTKEAQVVAHQMSIWELQPIVLTLKDPPDRRIQEEARQKRYEAMALFCHDHEISTLLLAHHQDDQLETFCMRLKAGSALFGLAAMLPVTHTQGLQFVRPLLDVPPYFLKEFLRAHKIAWIEDPSNQNSSFLRVRIRRLLSLLPEEERGFWVKECGRLNQQRRTLEKACTAFLSLSCRWEAAGYAVVNLEALLALSTSVQLLLLGKILRRVGGYSPHPLAKSSLRRVLEALSQVRFQAMTLGGCVLRKRGRELFIVREWQRIKPMLLDTERQSLLWDGRFYIAFQEDTSLNGLTLRARGRRIENLENKNFPEAQAALPALFRGETCIWPSESSASPIRSLKWL